MESKKRNNHQKKRDSNKKNTFADEFLGGIDKEKILSNAQDIISSAVNVLEEEIAAGILAAKKIEKEVIDVDDIRNDSDDLMNRIRRDTHDAVDLFMDALTAITKHVTELSGSLNHQNGASNKTDTAVSDLQKNGHAISMIRPDHPLEPGESVVLKMVAADGLSEEPVKIAIQKTDLTGPGKKTIHSRAIKVEPPVFVLEPGEEKEISVQISLPKNSAPGTYHALLTDANNHDFRVVLGLEVTQ
jgi:hypothetical protein